MQAAVEGEKKIERAHRHTGNGVWEGGGGGCRKRVTFSLSDMKYLKWNDSHLTFGHRGSTWQKYVSLDLDYRLIRQGSFLHPERALSGLFI